MLAILRNQIDQGEAVVAGEINAPVRVPESFFVKLHAAGNAGTHCYHTTSPREPTFRIFVDYTIKFTDGD